MYTVQTTTFQGPLHVLLELIEDHKMDITALSLAEVTQQFLEHIKTLGTEDPNLLADFLTVASKLLVLKSKSLLPTLEIEVEEEEGDLTYQLLQFKKFKLVAEYLKKLDAKKQYMFAHEGTIDQITTFYPDPQVNTGVLHDSMQAIARSIEEITKLPQEAVREVVSISQKIKELQESITEKIELTLSYLLYKKSKTEIVVTFLAMLELIKQRVLTVEQENLFSEIQIKRL